MKSKINFCLAATALAILMMLATKVAAQSQGLQQGYVPPAPVQGSSRQTLTLPQVAPQPATPPSALEIPSSQALERPPQPPFEAPLESQPSATVGRISITAQDGSGHWIEDLRKQDLDVYEDGVRRPVLGVQRDSDTPISIGFVVDTSGSMEWKLRAAEAALEHFVRTLNPRDQFFLIAFSNRAFLLQDFTENPADLNRAISILHAEGQTALYDAVIQGLRKVEYGRWPKKALLVMTDGMDNVSRNSLGDVIQAARRGGVLIYTVGLGTTSGSSMGFGMGPTIMFGGAMIGFGGRGFGRHMGGMGGGDDERVDAATLRTLSYETGATTFVMNPRVVDMSRLDAHFQDISTELRQQYTVRYASAGGDRAHQIRVESARPGIDIRAPKWAGAGASEMGG